MKKEIYNLEVGVLLDENHIELHEKILFELFKHGLTLGQIGILKGEI